MIRSFYKAINFTAKEATVQEKRTVLRLLNIAVLPYRKCQKC